MLLCSAKVKIKFLFDRCGMLFGLRLLRNGIFSYLCSLNKKLVFEVNVKSSFPTGESSATVVCMRNSRDEGCCKGRTELAREHRANV